MIVGRDVETSANDAELINCRKTTRLQDNSVAVESVASSVARRRPSSDIPVAHPSCTAYCSAPCVLDCLLPWTGPAV